MRDLQELIPFAAQADPFDSSVILATVVQTGEVDSSRLGTRLLLTECDHSIEAICDGYVDLAVIEQAKENCRGVNLPYIHQDTDCDRRTQNSGYHHDFESVTGILFEQLSSVSVKAQFDFITECYQENQAGAIATIIAVEGSIRAQVAARLFLKMDGSVANHIEDNFLTNLIFQDTVKILAAGQTRCKRYPFLDGSVTALIEVVTPPIQLLIFGSSTQTMPMILFAKQLGWTAIVLVPPSQDDNLHLYPEADQTLLYEWGDLPAEITLTPHTAAVITTRHCERDLALMKRLWPSAVGYLGIMGTKTWVQQLLRCIHEAGLSTAPQQDRRLHSPIGLDIGAETPTEIALAIVTEIQATLKHRTGTFLRDQQNSLAESAPTFSMRIQ